MKQEDKFNKIFKETTKQYDTTLKALASDEDEECGKWINKKSKIEESKEKK